MHYCNKDIFYHNGLFYATCDVYIQGEYTFQAMGSGLTPQAASQAMYKEIIDYTLAA